MKKFWLFISSILSALLLVVGLSACNPKQVVEDYTITSVKANNLSSTYHTSDTINFSDVTIEVTFKNGTKVTLTQGEVDIEKENAKEGTQFILNTDGLGTQTAGELEEGEYQISVYLSAYATTKQDLMTVTVTDNLSTKYNLISFTEPDFVTTYNENVASAGALKDAEDYESSFFKAPEAYYVGDDNEFRFETILTLRNKTTKQTVELKNFKVNVKVNGETVVEGTQYDEFKYENFKFYFTEEAIGKTYVISMLPAYFTTDFAGNNIEPATLAVKVADGYNVYDAVDLGRLSLVSDAFKADAVRKTYERWQSAEKFPKAGGGFERVLYYDLWKDFLESKGKTNLQPVNGMFIHNDITVNPETDIPSKYLISASEAGDNAYVVGSFRDEAWLYPHYMENDFTFNGNMFKLDFSNIKWCLTSSEQDGFYYTENQSQFWMGHAVLFGFLGKTDNTSTQKAMFQNVECLGNSKNITLKTETEANEASGSFIMLKADASETDVDNCIAKAFMISFYSEYNKKLYSDDEEPVLLANNGLDVSYCKIYDGYNSALFSYEGENNTLTNSELKRFGGPAIFLICGTADNGSKEGGAEWVVDSNTTIESYVAGDEAWFGITPGASGIAGQLMQLDQVFNAYGKTFLKDGKINMNALVLESAYLGSNDKVLYSYLSYGDLKLDEAPYNYPLQLDGEADNPINQVLTLTQYKAPIFLTNGGTLVFFDGTKMTADGANQFAGPFAGDKLIIVYPAGNTLAVVVCDLTDYVAA